MIYMGSNESITTKFKAYTKKKFEMSNLGQLYYFLGLEVKQGADVIFPSQ